MGLLARLSIAISTWGRFLQLLSEWQERSVVPGVQQCGIERRHSGGTIVSLVVGSPNLGGTLVMLSDSSCYG